ncbi:MAG: VOC family protein [Hyphomonadaceae bacterium]|nr:VOC family protein [Hyphomonadaceae bacterium]
MVSLHGLHHVGLTVAQLERSITFYQGVFSDLELVGPWTHSGKGVGDVTGYPGCTVRQAFLRDAKARVVIELLEYTNAGEPIDPANGNAGAVHFCVEIDDIDETYDRLIQAGYSFVSSPFTTTKNPVMHGRVAYLIDPDGIRVELMQPL